MSGENINRPKFICYFDMNIGVHQMVPIDWIKAISPQFERSTTIASIEPVIGRTLVTMKDSNGAITPHTMEEWALMLDATVMQSGDKAPATKNDDGSLRLTVIPDKTTIVLADVTNISAISKEKK